MGSRLYGSSVLITIPGLRSKVQKNAQNQDSLNLYNMTVSIALDTQDLLLANAYRKKLQIRKNFLLSLYFDSMRRSLLPYFLHRNDDNSMLLHTTLYIQLTILAGSYC